MNSFRIAPPMSARISVYTQSKKSYTEIKKDARVTD